MTTVFVIYCLLILTVGWMLVTVDIRRGIPGRDYVRVHGVSSDRSLLTSPAHLCQFFPELGEEAGERISRSSQ